MTQRFTKADGRRSERQMENHFLAVYASPVREEGGGGGGEGCGGGGWALSEEATS